MADTKKPRAGETELSETELDEARGGASAPEPAKKPTLGNQPFTPHSAILPYIEQDN